MTDVRAYSCSWILGILTDTAHARKANTSVLDRFWCSGEQVSQSKAIALASLSRPELCSNTGMYRDQEKTRSLLFFPRVIIRFTDRKGGFRSLRFRNSHQSFLLLHVYAQVLISQIRSDTSWIGVNDDKLRTAFCFNSGGV